MVPSMKGSFMQTNYMAKVILFGPTEKPIKDHGLNLKCMAKGNYNFQMEEYIKGYNSFKLLNKGYFEDKKHGLG